MKEFDKRLYQPAHLATCNCHCAKCLFNDKSYLAMLFFSRCIHLDFFERMQSGLKEFAKNLFRRRNVVSW